MGGHYGKEGNTRMIRKESRFQLLWVKAIKETDPFVSNTNKEKERACINFL